MKKIKYGKIKCQPNLSNIYGVSAQLIIHMKQLIELLYKSYEHSELYTIPAIIDIYQQMQSKFEYLDIDPFVHAINREIKIKEKMNNFSNFKDFFSSIIEKIDFADMKKSLNGHICCTILESLLDDENEAQNIEVQSRFFDIRFEDNKYLSQMIVEQYKLPIKIYEGPYFLFFSPKNKNEPLLNLKIDENVQLALSKYKLSIIVVKYLKNRYDGHFVLYICLDNWIEIDDEEITLISNEEIFKKIKNQTRYRIELLGYCRDPENSIISVDLSNAESESLEYFDIDKIDPTQITESNDLEIPDESSSDHEKTKIFEKRLSYKIIYVDFDVKSFSSKNISTKIFNSAEQRNKYVDELEMKSHDESKILFYDSKSQGFGHYKDTFSDDDFNIIVYSVSKSSGELCRPICITFLEKNESSMENPSKEIYAFFNKSTSVEQLYEYSYKKLPGNPNKLFTKYKDTFKNIKNSRSSISFIGYSNKIYYETSSFDDEQKSKSKAKVELKSNDILIVTCYCRLYYFNTEKSKKILRLTFLNKKDRKFKVTELLTNYIISKSSTTSLKSILTYYIKQGKNNFMVEEIEKDEKISELPSFINIQVRPYIKFSYRYCVIFDINCIDIASFEPNKDGYPFVIKYKEASLFNDVINSILDYLFASKEVADKKNEEYYIPLIYRFQNGNFIQIDDCDFIEENKLEPIFVSWNDSDAYKEIVKIIKCHIEASQPEIK